LHIDTWQGYSPDSRKASAKKKTIKHFQDQSGKHFDPNVVENFLEMMRNDQSK